MLNSCAERPRRWRCRAAFRRERARGCGRSEASGVPLPAVAVGAEQPRSLQQAVEQRTNQTDLINKLKLFFFFFLPRQTFGSFKFWGESKANKGPGVPGTPHPQGAAASGAPGCRYCVRWVVVGGSRRPRWNRAAPAAGAAAAVLGGTSPGLPRASWELRGNGMPGSCCLSCHAVTLPQLTCQCGTHLSSEPRQPSAHGLPQVRGALPRPLLHNPYSQTSWWQPLKEPCSTQYWSRTGAVCHISHVSAR